MKLRKKEYILISAFLLSITPALARQPRFYLPRDPGSNYITLFQRYIWASEQYNYGQKMSKNMDFEKWQFSAAFTHFFEYRNRLIRLDILDSYGYVSMGKTGVTNQGFSDPLIAIGVELVEHKEQRFFLVFTQAIILPAGSYDADKGTINMGQNRWRSQSELGASKWIGKLCIEIAGNLMLFSDNNDFGASGARLTQDPLLNMESHLSYNLTPRKHLALSYYYNHGGERFLNDSSFLGEPRMHNIMLSAFTKIQKNNNVRLFYQQDLHRHTGLMKYTLGIRFIQRF